MITTAWRLAIGAMLAAIVFVAIWLLAAPGAVRVKPTLGGASGQPGESKTVHTGVAASGQTSDAPLAEDGRIGKIADAQGAVWIKAAMASRWTPVTDGMLIMPGDWLQTDNRGANGATVRLAGNGRELVVGPGTLVELSTPGKIRVTQGEVQVVAGLKAPVQLMGMGDQKVDVTDRGVYRVDKEKLVRLESDPAWLKGFEGRAVSESLGSLVARVDGRNVPLTVGYHKVSVDIRDQIARTVVEESFVNTTDRRLEGVFYFPLPQDASISGFAMWIDGELVEADVVEKQRAREIFEEILRQRRDPALLEWSGGNMFKARVFPIEARSEKRIQITYTQVLAMRGGSYRYSYALQSEMLRQHPLRELQIDVRLSSAVPLKAVTCPSHAARTDVTANAAHVEFAAQEYTPTRDFEVSVEVDSKQPQVVLIPHRRGDDGYFMLMLTAPGGESQRRDVLPDALAGGQQELLMLADTSAPVDASQRNAQAQFIAALLGSLGAEDTFNLAGCDVDCDWVFDKPRQADAGNVAAARDFLAKRPSLGWSDLDKAFASAIARSSPRTKVVYVGGGIVTTGDADPAAFAKRLKLLYQGKSSPNACYAVSVGSTYESGVLKAITSLGGGSVRQISPDLSGQKSPRGVAMDLLDEILHEKDRPPLRDLKVEFPGLATARVYPEELPNVPEGSQQILLGRFLPKAAGAGGQSGEVVITGTRAGRPVRYSTHVSLPSAGRQPATQEGGEVGDNSFIPRQWARMHLDFLLSQPSAPSSGQKASQGVKDEIIALSQEYHIMTPYTSFLVLESDADRERFKVTRRFLMRDGEKFFAQGRDNANYALTQQQMTRAGAWRLGLRRAVLRQLGGLGRDSLASPTQGYDRSGSIIDVNSTDINSLIDISSVTRQYGQSAGTASGSGTNVYDIRDLVIGIPNFPQARVDLSRSTEQCSGGGQSCFGSGSGQSLFGTGGGQQTTEQIRTRDIISQEDTDSPAPGGQPMVEDDVADASEDVSTKSDSGVALGGGTSYGSGYGRDVPDYLLASEHRMPGAAAQGWLQAAAADIIGTGASASPSVFGSTDDSTQWVGTLFPQLATPDRGPAPQTMPPDRRWSAEARAISDSLLRKSLLSAIKGGLVVDKQCDTFSQTGQLEERDLSHKLMSPTAWLLRQENDAQQTTLQWCDAKECGIIGKGFMLGRMRPAAAGDIDNPPLDFSAYAWESLERVHQESTVEVKPQAQGQTLLVLTQRDDPHCQYRILVDSARHVVLSEENITGGMITGTAKYSDFVEVAGGWWPTRYESFDEKGRLTAKVAVKIAALGAQEFDKQFQAELAGKASVQFLAEPARSVWAAKRSVALGHGDFDDQMALLLHFAQSQQWAKVMEHLDAAERLSAKTGDKPGMRWVRDAVLQVGRKREELKNRLLARAADLAKATPGRDDLPLAQYMLDTATNDTGMFGNTSQLFESNETLTLMDALKPVFQRQPPRLHGMTLWNSRRVDVLGTLGRNEEALALTRQIALDNPSDCSRQLDYVKALVTAGQTADAYAWLNKALADTQWPPADEETLRVQYAEMLHKDGRYEDLATYTSKWMQRELPDTQAYGRCLESLTLAGRDDEASKLLAQWLKEGASAQPPTGPAGDRLAAAVTRALGRSYWSGWNGHMEEQWRAPLEGTAMALAAQQFHADAAEQIMNNSEFQKTEQCRRVRKAALAILQTQIDKLTPCVVQRLVDWAMVDDPPVEPTVRKGIAAALHKRWLTEPNPDRKDALGATLVQIYSGPLFAEDHLAFLREEVKDGPTGYRPAYAAALLEVLSRQPWQEKCEDEALTLINQLSDSPQAQVRLESAVHALYILDDRMVQARLHAKMAAIAHPEDLPRAELQARRKENLRLARSELAQRLEREAAKLSGPIAAWLQAESVHLDVLSGGSAAKAAGASWKFLGAEPKKFAPQASLLPAGETAAPELALDSALRCRVLQTLMNLACRKNAPPALLERVSKFIDQGIAMDQEDQRWKFLKYELLVALDRPKELEATLAGWTGDQDPDNRWKLSLGYLLAEQGKLLQAIKLFEAVAAADELAPAQYRTLADWYMAINHRDQYRDAMNAVYRLAPEDDLAAALEERIRPWVDSGGEAPATIDEQVPQMFAALFEKSGQHSYRVDTLRGYYSATHDSRLLSGLGEVLVGRTAGTVYPLLASMGSVLEEIHDEAASDAIVDALAKTRQHSTADTDRRALDLLEALVERRASEMLDQPGPHGEKALAALKRTFKGAWSPGEQRLMASVLAGMGNIQNIQSKPLADEQVRELEALYRDVPKGSADRLQIALDTANTYWRYSRDDDAMDLLEATLEEFRQANGGVLPASANDALDKLVGYCEDRGHHARGEKILLEQLNRPANDQQKIWLADRLYKLYEHAVGAGSPVSLGCGAVLYKAIEQRIIAELDTPDESRRSQLVSHLCSFYTLAHSKQFSGAADDLRAFVSKNLAGVLKRQTGNYQSVVSTVTDAIKRVAGPREAMAFLIEQIEQEQSWVRWNSNQCWASHAYTLAKLKTDVGDLGDLDGRLLKIVLEELRHDLQAERCDCRYLYWAGNDFWEAKKEDFRKVAEEVYAQRHDCGSDVAYVAKYIADNLGLRARAIEMLYAAHKANLLDEAGQWQLADCLRYENREPELIDLLKPMIQRWPDNFDYREALMHAYFQTKRHEELLSLADDTEKHFRNRDILDDAARTEPGSNALQAELEANETLAKLAKCCLDVELYEQAVKYYKEVIPLYQWSAPSRDDRDSREGTLSEFYQNLAHAYQCLGRTAEAVDAACGAIVIWGAHTDERAEAIASLKAVIREAPKLDELVADLDRQAKDRGMDNPIVRKAVGQAYLATNEFAKALVQLKLACELQPNDKETHDAIIACFDGQGDNEGGAGQILELLQLTRRDISLYADLGRRYDALQRPKDRERAYTSIVAVLPNESEGHAMLAEIRQSENRWPEAAAQWEHVARIRALEPTGLLNLGAAQAHLGQWDQLAKTIRALRAKTWPPRFKNVDEETGVLQVQLDAGRKAVHNSPQ
jgi:tetratricopeptide (TPR) repeat protein